MILNTMVIGEISLNVEPNGVESDSEFSLNIAASYTISSLNEKDVVYHVGEFCKEMRLAADQKK